METANMRSAYGSNSIGKDKHNVSHAARDVTPFHKIPITKMTAAGIAMKAQHSWKYENIYSKRDTTGAHSAPITSTAKLPALPMVMSFRCSVSGNFF